MDYDHLHDTMVNLTLDAGMRSLEHFRSRDFTRERKADGSIVTSADLDADRIIAAGLGRKYAGIPLISEEGDTHAAPDDGRFFLVDPIDGTAGFASGNPEYTINIAYLEDNRPLIGVVYAPALGWICHNTIGMAVFSDRSIDGDRLPSGLSSCVNRMPADNGNLRAVVSRSRKRGESELAMLEDYSIIETLRASSSLKFNMLVTGEADIYPRMGNTREWDTAAGDAILRASGGSVITRTGDRLEYGKKGLLNQAFIALGKGVSVTRCM